MSVGAQTLERRSTVSVTDSPEDDLVRRFANLYRGRGDVQGTEDGGCLHKRVTFGHYLGHFQGAFGLGIYPLRDDGTCAWALVDIDTDDLDRALLLRRLLHDGGVPALVLRSRARGYHVTVFVKGWARAADLRRILRAAALEAGLPPTTEIYPRSDAPPPGATAPGGYVRLPYVGALSDPARPGKVIPAPRRRRAFDPGPPCRDLALAEFLEVAEASQVEPERIRAWAEELGEEDAPPPRDALTALPEDPARLGVSPEIAALIRTGDPGQQYDSRSEVQLAVACALVGAGQADDTILAVLTWPGYGISQRALEQSPARRADAIRRCIEKARARVLSIPTAAAGSLTPILHRRLKAAGCPPLAWAVLAEILSTVDRKTGLSLATAHSLAAQLRCARATIYRTGLGPLLEVGIVESVSLVRGRGQWARTAFRVRVGAPGIPPSLISSEHPSELP